MPSTPCQIDSADDTGNSKGFPKAFVFNRDCIRIVLRSAWKWDVEYVRRKRSESPLVGRYFAGRCRSEKCASVKTVVCPACSRLHFIDRSNSKLLGEKEAQVADRGGSGLAVAEQQSRDLIVNSRNRRKTDHILGLIQYLDLRL